MKLVEELFYVFFISKYVHESIFTSERQQMEPTVYERSANLQNQESAISNSTVLLHGHLILQPGCNYIYFPPLWSTVTAELLNPEARQCALHASRSWDQCCDLERQLWRDNVVGALSGSINLTLGFKSSIKFKWKPASAESHTCTLSGKRFCFVAWLSLRKINSLRMTVTECRQGSQQGKLIS